MPDARAEVDDKAEKVRGNAPSGVEFQEEIGLKGGNAGMFVSAGLLDDLADRESAVDSKGGYSHVAPYPLILTIGRT